MSAAVEDKQDRMREIMVQVFSPAPGLMLNMDKTKFEELLEDPRSSDLLKMLEISHDEARRYNLFGLIDENMSGQVEAHELVGACLRLAGPPKAFNIARLALQVSEISRSVS